MDGVRRSGGGGEGRRVYDKGIDAHMIVFFNSLYFSYLGWEWWQGEDLGD